MSGIMEKKTDREKDKVGYNTDWMLDKIIIHAIIQQKPTIFTAHKLRFWYAVLYC